MIVVVFSQLISLFLLLPSPASSPHCSRLNILCPHPQQAPFTIVSEGVDFIRASGYNQGPALGNAVFIGFVEVLRAFRGKVALLVKFCASETDCKDVRFDILTCYGSIII